ncbi:hypothetical protein A9G45_03360 [Gilliamella sp. HK2]|uniref:type VI secretion system tip protein VgrG n=1 Tax=unclassified Gilliamella TaxID=2685620 RepID=UPI00080E784D|nr:type VI secretion system tip protein VgrG [Gilliamella apicola]OCG26633.1 hypothetical protein A9G46_04510 [Gilliamella apicola]OCG29878.1 hypothetical protein A9G45_03360 [Gilliamella apicola]
MVEEVLRSHGFTGIDYRLALKDSYPEREFITQWQESDLEFIQRLLADVGIWFRFETHAEHDCDVMVLSDYEQGYAQVANIDYKLPSGMADTGVESVWDITLHSEVVPASVTVQDYNYRDAKADLLTDINTQPKTTTTQGTDYRYEEHYKSGQGQQSKPNDKATNPNQVQTATPSPQDDSIEQDNAIESGQWYAKIRHEQAISQQIILTGKSNRYQLAPGQLINITGSPLKSIEEGVIILSVQGQGNRTDAYALTFTAIPYQALKPYRPTPIRWPQVSGTLPARVTSPDNDTYGYIDTHGRYRVKFNFDLKTWKKGTESLWVRLAKPYSGNTYGFHFPLIDGTEVAIAFMNGNPDRPYIAHAMHDSAHPDHVTTVNKHRNVIRTPANNKLRMDDKRGQEHIKLATEYGKSQLNLGHLVDNKKAQRGEGFELRTDEWGAIAANRGLYLTTQTEPKAQGKQLDMQAAISQLENALSIAKALQNAATQSDAHSADTDSQDQLKANLSELTQSGLLAYAQEGIALTSPENIQLTTNNSLTLTSENQTDITALKNITVSSAEAIGLFAQKLGMKLFANQSDIEVQAQNANLNMAAKQDIKVDSVDGKVTITASDEIKLICGGSYIKISSAGIELGTQDNVYFKCNVMQKMGVSSLDYKSTLLSGAIPQTFTTQDKQEGITLYLETDDGYPIPTTKYQVRFDNGEFRQGRLDREGKVVLKHVPPNMDYYYQFPDDDDILAKANAQRLHKAIEAINSKQMIGYLAYSKNTIEMTIDAYKEIYGKDMVKDIYQALGPYHKDKLAIDYLFAKADIKTTKYKVSINKE